MSQRFKKLQDQDFPYNQDLSKFAPPFIPIDFTDEQKKFLSPFFTNLDKPVYILKNMPEEVAGAVSSRYSRSIYTIRELFWKEYILPILHPEEQKDWEALSDQDKEEALTNKQDFIQTVDFLNAHGGIEGAINTPRARKFYRTWYIQYGDESITEETAFHVGMDGLSGLALEEIVNKRLSLALIVKSSRYVPFHQKRADGNYQYIVPGEIKGTKYEQAYIAAMNKLFEAYSNVSEPYFDYICQKYPKDSDETDTSFKNSRSAKRFDDIRDLLPFATQTNVAFTGNGRAFNDLVNRLLGHPLGEICWWGKELNEELSKFAPSLFSRPKDITGARMQLHRKNLHYLRSEMAKNVVRKNGVLAKPEDRTQDTKWVKLIDYTKEADIKILSSFIFVGQNELGLEEVLQKVAQLSEDERAKLLAEIIDSRKVDEPEGERAAIRFRKVPREFENAEFTFEITGRGGDFRDLHRHRINTQQNQRFTTALNYDLEQEVLDSPFSKQIVEALVEADELYKSLADKSSDLAQYAVPYGYLQRWYMKLTAREIYYMLELRTGPQGRPHYREICQEIGKLAQRVSPAIFQGMMIDWNDYRLSRRESEKKIEKKLMEITEKYN